MKPLCLGAPVERLATGSSSVPLDPSNGWGLSLVTWREGARRMVRAFAAVVGGNILAFDSELEELGSQPLKMFVEYLVDLGTEAFAARSFQLKSDPESTVLASTTQEVLQSRSSGSKLPIETAKIPKRYTLYKVWFGTNRMSIHSDVFGEVFSSRRADHTRYGHCDVHVPASHSIGSIGSSVLRRLIKRTDDRLTLRRIAQTEAGEVWRGLKAQLESVESGKRHAVVFIHGYNVSFEDAAIRAAQIGFDLGVEAMAFFSWPSKGTVSGYFADGSSIEASEEAITDFLVSFANNVDAEAFHVTMAARISPATTRSPVSATAPTTRSLAEGPPLRRQRRSQRQSVGAISAVVWPFPDLPRSRTG